MLQGHNEDLYRLLHQLFPVVGEQQVVVRDPITHRIISAHHVEQRREQRQGVSVKKNIKNTSGNHKTNPGIPGVTLTGRAANESRHFCHF